MPDADENDANAANFKEITEHINVVQQRLRTMNVGTDKYNQTVEDLSDYYERAIQDRTMRITTLEELCRTRETMHTATQWRLWFVSAMAVLTVVFSAIALFPHEFGIVYEAVQPYATTDRIVVNFLIGMWVYFVLK